MKTVAVTGATGFIGRHTVRTLIDEGWQVRALTRRPQPQLANLTWIAGDLGDQPALRELMKGTQALVHLAGAIAARSKVEFLSINVGGTDSALRAAAGAGARHVIHVSSLAARRPEVSDYAFSKHESEKLLASFPGGLIVRPCAVYGEGDAATLPLIRELFKARALIPATPQSRFSMIHAADVASAIAAFLKNQRTGTAEISDGAGAYGWHDLAAITRRHFGTPAHLAFAPKRLAKAVAALSEFYAAVTRSSPLATRGAIEQLYAGDWIIDVNASPLSRHIGLEEGLLRTIEGYQATGQLPARAKLATAQAKTRQGGRI